MKRCKITLPVVALLLGVIAAFAFKPLPHSSLGAATHASYFWYKLNTGGDKNNPNDYTKVMSEPTCVGSTNVCAVHAQDNGSGRPLGIPPSGNVVPDQYIDQVDHRS